MEMKIKRETVSVAMAVYNGEKYLDKQIGSILPQLSTDDELVISVDPSRDRSEDILKKYAEKDRRIKVLNGLGEGLIRNFEHALRGCKNEIIFLCDQDDIWHEDKVQVILNGFSDPNVILQVHDARLVDADGAPMKVTGTFFQNRKSRPGIGRNIVKNSFMGCCMAFRRQLLEECLPFPRKIPMHDQWIGLVAQFNGKVIFLKQVLIDYRRHGHNASPDAHSKWQTMIKWRYSIICSICKYKWDRRLR